MAKKDSAKTTQTAKETNVSSVCPVARKGHVICLSNMVACVIAAHAAITITDLTHSI